MRLLIVSWYFPPVNTIGALRVGKLARFLIERGHDIGVVAGSHWGHPETLPLGAPLSRVTFAHVVDVNAVPKWLSERLKRRAKSGTGAMVETPILEAEPHSNNQSILQRLASLYTNLTNLPDNRIGWLPWARTAGLHLCKDWRPNLVFASGPPFTAFLAARSISKRLGVPWIAELRDRWADDPYGIGEYPAWRLRLDQWLERRVLDTAKGLVTVTEPWAEFYRRKYGKPLATIYNGYDPADFPASTERATRIPGAPLIIGYTGGIYPGKRDPTPLFQALRLLGTASDSFRVVFCGTDPAHVFPLAERTGVRHLVEVRPPVPYQQSLAFQREADILLLMQWNDPREQGSCPGKLFEYVASLRPIIVLGLEDGVPATIVRERSAGFCSNDPRLLAKQLKRWLEERKEFGEIRALPLSAREGLSRTIQFEHLEKFLEEMARAT